MNYYVLDEDGIYVVVEKQTNNVVKRSASRRDAIAYTLFLSNGGGFDGWTRKFALR